MPSQDFPRPLNQQLDKISDPIPTNDVLADALLVTETTYFKGSGSSYTGTVPSNNFKYGVFCVVKRNDASFIVHATSADGTSSNYYDGSAWGGWTPSTSELNEQIVPVDLSSSITYDTAKITMYTKIVHKIGSLVVVQLNGLGSSSVGTDDDIVFGFPAPTYQVSFSFNASDSNVCRGKILRNTGTIRLDMSNIKSKYFNISFCYVAV